MSTAGLVSLDIGATGWHWLVRKSDGEKRLAFWSSPWWRISDNLGRTKIYTIERAERLYHHHSAVAEPDD